MTELRSEVYNNEIKSLSNMLINNSSLSDDQFDTVILHSYYHLVDNVNCQLQRIWIIGQHVNRLFNWLLHRRIIFRYAGNTGRRTVIIKRL